MVTYRFSANEACYDATMKRSVIDKEMTVEAWVVKLHVWFVCDSSLALATRAGNGRCLADVWARVQGLGACACGDHELGWTETASLCTEFLECMEVAPFHLSLLL